MLRLYLRLAMLYLFAFIATIIIGEETLGATVIGPIAKKGMASKRIALKTGKLHALAFTLDKTSKCTELKLGIRAGAAGAVGGFLAETVTISGIPEATEITVEGVLEGGDIELTSGTEYFVCILPLAGAGACKWKATEKAAWGFKTNGAITKVSEGTWTTAENKYGEPAPVWGIEAVAEGAVSPQTMLL